MRSTLFALILTLFVLAPASWAAEEETQLVRPAPHGMQGDTELSGPVDLSRAVRRALEANPTIVSARAVLTGAEFGRKSALGAFGPSMSTSYGWTHRDPHTTASYGTTGDYDSWSLNLNIHQPIFTGFRLLSTYQKSILAKDQNAAQLNQAELSLTLAVQTAFLSLLKGRMDVKSAEDQQERLRSQLKVTEAFYQVGLKPRLDVLQAETDLATADQNLLVSQNNVATQTAKLNSLLNIPLEAKTSYVGELGYVPFSRTLDECLKQADTRRPDILIGTKSVDMADKDAKITASNYYPQVSADFNYNKLGDDASVSGSKYSGTSSADYWTAGAQVSWTFFEWGKTHYAVKQALETVNKIRSDLDNTRLNAGFEVKQYLLDMQAAADRIRVGNKAVESAREGYRMAVARYQAQVGTNTDVLDNQARVTTAEAQLNSALSDYQTALAKLFVSMGESNPGLATQ